jgi:hypothetical protein
MIAFFNPTYSTVSTATKAAHTGLKTGRKMPPTKPEYPLMLMFPIQNSQYERSMDSSSSENHVNAGIQIEVYSNKVSGAEAECESIMTTADEQMRTIGYWRNFCDFVPTADSSQTRLIARYRAVISKEGLVYHK